MTALVSCRACEGRELALVLDLGELPLADGFVAPAAAPVVDARYPVRLGLCTACGLAQLLDTVPRAELFGADYPYFSSYSSSWLAHARALARRLHAERRLDGSARVVEIASNDGYLLRHFQDLGIPCVGIEPTPGPAAAARDLGIDTRSLFFDAAVAEELVAEGGRADVVIANNVLAHVEDLPGFVAGLRILLAEDGLGVLEFGYLGDLFASLAWDTIYHEHLCVFSLTAAVRLLARHGLVATRVERLATQGGSLRLFVARRGVADASVAGLLAEEGRRGLADPRTHRDFGARVSAHVRSLRDFLGERHAAGRRIAGYGAAAKGTVLLNVAGIGPDLVPAIADRNPHKQGRLVPGVRIPVVSPEALRAQAPDDLLVLPWNLREEIIAQEAWIGARGGAFLLPLPVPTAIEPVTS